MRVAVVLSAVAGFLLHVILGVHLTEGWARFFEEFRAARDRDVPWHFFFFFIWCGLPYYILGFGVLIRKSFRSLLALLMFTGFVVFLVVLVFIVFGTQQTRSLLFLIMPLGLIPFAICALMISPYFDLADEWLGQKIGTKVPPVKAAADLFGVSEADLGRCPNCGEVLRFTARECPQCTALLGPNSSWKVIPLDS